MQLQLSNASTGEQVSGLADLYTLATLSSGWNNRFAAQALENGVYEVEITVPEPGVYFVYFEIPSMEATYNQFPNITLNAQAEEN